MSSADEAQQKANDLILSAAGDVAEAFADAVTKSLYTAAKVIAKIGGAAGASEHASKMRFAEAPAKKKGCTTAEAFQELDDLGLFDDRFY